MKKIIALFSLALLLTACGPQSRTVSLFYYQAEKDPDVTCREDAFLPVQREIKVSDNIYRDTLALLIEGDLSQQEVKDGFSTEFPNTDFKLLKADLTSNGILNLDFTVVPGFTDGGSLRMRMMTRQIEKTALQFPEVKSIKIENEELFQP